MGSVVTNCTDISLMVVEEFWVIRPLSYVFFLSVSRQLPGGGLDMLQLFGTYCKSPLIKERSEAALAMQSYGEAMNLLVGSLKMSIGVYNQQLV